jgi:hypothetical protein
VSEPLQHQPLAVIGPGFAVHIRPTGRDSCIVWVKDGAGRLVETHDGVTYLAARRILVEEVKRADL